jgi:beta-aspartyl-peptidase (threonine type)
MTNKRWNRVGDTPVIGAGTFADNATCAVSCTGHGEFFIRWTVARDIAAMMEYGGATLAEAADRMVMDKLARAGGEGGVIAVDRTGHVAMPFNAEGMYRGYAVPGRRFVGIFKDETDGSSR